jgi:hypothetical protein
MTKRLSEAIRRKIVDWLDGTVVESLPSHSRKQARHLVGLYLADEEERIHAARREEALRKGRRILLVWSVTIAVGVGTSYAASQLWSNRHPSTDTGAPAAACPSLGRSESRRRAAGDPEIIVILAPAPSVE